MSSLEKLPWLIRVALYISVASGIGYGFSFVPGWFWSQFILGFYISSAGFFLIQGLFGFEREPIKDDLRWKMRPLTGSAQYTKSRQAIWYWRIPGGRYIHRIGMPWKRRA